MGPKAMTGFLIRRERFGCRGTQKEEGHGKAEEETGVVLPQPRSTKDCQQITEARKKQEIIPYSLQREYHPAETLTFDF